MYTVSLYITKYKVSEEYSPRKVTFEDVYENNSSNSTLASNHDCKGKT